jgi:beta-lactam-binding protein with PASTA domain
MMFVVGCFPVMCEGLDFSGSTAVLFGVLPAAFTVNSDFEITATAPPSSTPGKVGITVQTPAGTTPSAKQFAYIACTVPKLKDRRLKSAKGRLRRKHCKPGRVKKLPGATAKTGRVVGQHPKPGSILPPGAAVSITLKKQP